MMRRMTFEEFQYLMMAGIDSEISEGICQAMQTLSGRWRLPILYVIFQSSGLRFNEIKRQLKEITSRQLIIELRQLEEMDFVSKSKSESDDNISLYSLKQKGSDLIYLFYDYMNWANTYAQ